MLRSQGLLASARPENGVGNYSEIEDEKTKLTLW
jgi:hypothetical protein